MPATTGTFGVPAEATEEFGGSSDFILEPGPYLGTVENVNLNELTPVRDDGGTWEGFSEAGEAETVGIQVGQIEPLDDQEDPGNRKLFLPEMRSDGRGGSLVVRDGDRTADNTDVSERGVDHWRLNRDTGILMGLARVLGVAQTTGDAVVLSGFDSFGDFVDALRDGTFDGQQIGFEIGHRSWTNSNDDKVTAAFVENFFKAP